METKTENNASETLVFFVALWVRFFQDDNTQLETNRLNQFHPWWCITPQNEKPYVLGILQPHSAWKRSSFGMLRTGLQDVLLKAAGLLGRNFGTFWGVELIPVKNGNQHWKRLLGGDVFPQTNHNHPFCLGSLSEDLHCSYCWWWWFLSFFWGEKIWKNRPETWGISMLFHSPGWRKKTKQAAFRRAAVIFSVFFFRNLGILRSEIGGRRNWENSNGQRRKCRLKHILKVKIGWLYSQCQKAKCENRPWKKSADFFRQYSFNIETCHIFGGNDVGLRGI